MVDKHQEFKPIAIDLLRRFKRAMVFDIYLKRSESGFTKLFHKNDPIDWQRVDHYQGKGTVSYFVSEEEFPIYCMFVEKLGEHLKSQIDNIKPEESVGMLKDLVQFSMFEMVERLHIDEETVQLSAQVVNTCVDELASNKEMLLNFIRAMATSPYLYKHATSVSMLSILLARQMGIEGAANLKNIGLGGLLHDVGEGKLDFDPEDKEILSPAERSQLWCHPQFGKDFLEELPNIKREVVEIVLQHHEQPNGHGYPLGLRDSEIYPPAKIVGAVDTFCAMLSNRPWRKAFSTAEALEKMGLDRGKYCSQVLKALKKMVLQS